MKTTNYYFLLWVVILLQSCATTQNVDSNQIPKATASASELVRITNEDIPEFSPKLAPDGTKLIYTSRDDAKYGTERWSIRLKSDVNKPGFSPITDAHCLSPSWHPNSNKFIYSYFKGQEPILAISSTQSLGITFVAQKGYGEYDYDASYAPNGEKILLSTTIQGKTAIGIVNANGQNFTLIGEGGTPVWHPSGESIAFVKNSGEYTHIFFYNLKNNQITQITSGEFHHLYPHFSPSGEEFVFVSNRDSETFHIYTMNMDGTNLTQLTTGSTTEIHPFWGTDGYIYFSSDAGTKKRKTSFNRGNSKRGFNSFNAQKDAVADLVNLHIGWDYADIWRLKPLLIQ